MASVVEAVLATAGTDPATAAAGAESARVISQYLVSNSTSGDFSLTVEADASQCDIVVTDCLVPASEEPPWQLVVPHAFRARGISPAPGPAPERASGAPQLHRAPDGRMRLTSRHARALLR